MGVVVDPTLKANAHKFSSRSAKKENIYLSK